MTDYTAKADALLTFMQSLKHTPSTGHTFSAGWEAAKEDSKPLVVASGDDLYEQFDRMHTPRTGHPIYDAAQRLWIVHEDEDGEWWATSQVYEEDPKIFTGASSLDSAPIVYPIHILPIPQQSPVPQTGEPNNANS